MAIVIDAPSGIQVALAVEKIQHPGESGKVLISTYHVDHATLQFSLDGGAT